MTVRLGISILDLLPQTTGFATQIPDGIIEKIGVLTVLDHRSTTNNDFYLHEGTLQSLADALDVDVLLPGVRAAKKTGGTGVTPLTLQPTGSTNAVDLRKWQRVFR